MLQAYLRESEDPTVPEVRVHIWHPDIARPGIRDAGDIHDHRFDLSSTVLLGNVFHSEVTVLPGRATGTYELFTCVHARADIGARYQREPWNGHTGYLRMEELPDMVMAGERYFFLRGFLHRSWCEELAVTLVTKENQRDDIQARILAQTRKLVGSGRAERWEPVEPVHAFEADDDFDPAPYVEMASEGLLRRW